jgi:hydrogenase nickel incorporation protein HypA/HybF
MRSKPRYPGTGVPPLSPKNGYIVKDRQENFPMHEYSIAYDIYATARKAALEHQAIKINRIVIDIGEMAMVNPDQVEFLFRAIAEEDPLFKGVTFETHTIKPEVKCSCGYEGTTLYVCPVCGALPELVKGKEVLVSNIEVEVD